MVYHCLTFHVFSEEELDSGFENLLELAIYQINLEGNTSLIQETLDGNLVPEIGKDQFHQDESHYLILVQKEYVGRKDVRIPSNRYFRLD